VVLNFLALAHKVLFGLNFPPRGAVLYIVGTNCFLVSLEDRDSTIHWNIFQPAHHNALSSLTNGNIFRL